MTKTHLWRSIAALTTVIVGIAATATPAPASAHSSSTTAGQITFTKTGITPEVIDLAAAAPCPSGTINYDFGTTNTVINVTSISQKLFKTFASANGSGTYLIILTMSTLGGSQGNINTPTTFAGLRVPVVATIYNTYNATNCTLTGTPVCTLAVVLAMSGTITGISTSNTYASNGNSVGTVVSFTACAPGASFLIGTAATVTTSIAGHLA